MRLYLAGPAGVGKSTAASLLAVHHGFSVYRLSDLLRDRERPRGRAWLQRYGDRLRAAFGAEALAVAAHQAVLCDEDAAGRAIDAVVDGVRLPEEAGYLRQQGYRGLRIEAPEDLRRARLAAGGRSLAGPEAEHPTEQAAGDVPADLAIQNAGDLRGLDRALQSALGRLRAGG